MSCQYIDGSVWQKIPAHFILFTSYREAESQCYDVKTQSPLRLVSASACLGDEAHPGLMTD